MNLLFLYTEVMGYTLATLRALCDSGYNVHVVHWDHKKLTPFQADCSERIRIYPRSKFDSKSLLHLAKSLSPEILYVSGWQDSGYLPIARYFRSVEKPVVVGFDDIWFGTARQRMASFLCNFGYLSRYFSHAWVSGPWQFEYAQRMGFRKDQVVFDLYSADTSKFHTSYNRSFGQKESSYPHRFLFVGRLETRKGLHVLQEAWKQIRPHRKDWKLQFIGNGALAGELRNSDDLEVHDFKQPDELQEVIETAGCFVLPSIREPWGVVVHEFAAAGLPLILSNSVGASATFLIAGHNGHTFKSQNAQSLAECMRSIIETPDCELLSMGQRSNLLSQRISPQNSAASFLSIIDKT